MGQASDLLRSTYVSYTRISTFTRCPKRFKLVYIDEHAEIASPEKQLGKLTHETIAKYLRSIRGNPELHFPSLSILTPYLHRARKQLIESGEIDESLDITPVRAFLENFSARMPRIDGRAVCDIESTKTTRIGEWHLRSVLDLTLIRADGTMSIVDFKTGNSRYVTREQIRLYALHLFEGSGYQHENLELCYHFLRDGSVKSHSMARISSLAVKDKLATKIQKIEACETWLAKLSPLCEWCGVRNVCTEYKSQGGSKGRGSPSARTFTNQRPEPSVYYYRWVKTQTRLSSSQVASSSRPAISASEIPPTKSVTVPVAPEPPMPEPPLLAATVEPASGAAATVADEPSSRDEPSSIETVEVLVDSVRSSVLVNTPTLPSLDLAPASASTTMLRPIPEAPAPGTGRQTDYAHPFEVASDEGCPGWLWTLMAAALAFLLILLALGIWQMP